MSVILEFSIPGTDFRLGTVLSGRPEMHLELERLVPTGGMVMPFVWAIGPDQDEFEASVHAHEGVEGFVALDRIGDSGLYRVEWKEDPTDLIAGIAQVDAVILQATGNADWVFRLRFQDHEALSTFHNYVIEHDIPIHVDRTYTLTETTERGHRFGLSEEQREALLLALEEGYFETPRTVSLGELADRLEISRQALSDRIRRGNRKILRDVLLSTAREYD